MSESIPKLQASLKRSSASQVVVRNLAVEPQPRSREAGPGRALSKLPTFVRGRVLARRFFVDEVFEFAPQCTFVRAHDLELERVVLVRLLPRSDRSEAQRENTSGWFTRLDHPLSSPGILGTLGVGVLSGGWPLLVCQYWRGRSLAALLRSGEAPNLLLVLQIARQVAIALDEAHALGHAHGELRSDDVWLGRQADGGERAMLLGVQARERETPHAELVARDLNAFGDLLSLMVASLRPRHLSPAQQAAFEYAPDSGPLIVLVGPLARVAARCQGTGSERRYHTAGDVARALEQVESIATQLTGQ